MNNSLPHESNIELADIQYHPIRECNFEYWFKTIEHNGKTLSAEERTDFYAFADDIISMFSSGLPLIQDVLESARKHNDDFHSIEYIICSVMQFIVITSIDCIVASKYFIMADTDYDRRFMRGKMMIILNEGFKRLYGFDDKTRKKSEWSRLGTVMEHFPADIRRQYAELTRKLENHSKSSSWWRDERNLETHLEAEKLYKSRMEDVIEGKVILDNLKLYNTLQAVSVFLENAHACL